jgi:type IV pilus assembly protein PilQ
MGKKMSMNKGLLYSFLLYPAAVLMLLSGCATGSSKAVDAGSDKPTAVLKSEAAPPVQQDQDASWKSVSDPAPSAPKEAKVAVQPATAEPAVVKPAVTEEIRDITPSEPRIFFEPSKSDVNEVLGIDFTMAENGKSRLMVTTAKKTNYNLDRKDEKTIILKINGSTIANPLLMRHIDTTQFQSALEGIKQVYSSKNKEVDLVISLREIVPFNIKPTETGITMDFGQTTVKVTEKKIVPLNLEETETETLSVKADTTTPAVSGSGTAAVQTKKYKGEKMYMDFVDADVTHILRLINEVSGENIVWDPAIAGKKVSMILKDVPWDEALELVLDNNDLAKRYRGENIIWITTKDKMKQILAEEEAEKERLRKLAEDEEQRRKEKEKAAKEEAPLVTEYLPVDFAKANDIKSHITVSKRGAMTVDTRTNTIILTDISENIETARKTIKQFDTPVKQIMIEAKIVEAKDTFRRDLGIKWNSNTSYWGTSDEVNDPAADDEFTVPPYANEFNVDGEKIFGGSFSTNSPDGWKSNIGLGFATATFNGRLTLDASLAIAESEGTAKTLSSPKVIAQEGTPAKISSGEIIKIQATENVKSEEWPAELSLSVTPNSISYNDYITLTVDVSDDARLSDSLKTTKNINTTLMVKSGETIVIGGIIKESEGNDVSGIPILKDIPGLGWLFKSKVKATSKSELLIFLTPTVIPSPIN